MRLAVSLALATSLAQVAEHVDAAPSRNCMHYVTRALHSGQMTCEDAVCGALRIPTDLRLTFTERLSDACKAQMDEYRLSNKTSRGEKLVAAQPGSKSKKCAADLGSANPNNPVVVQSGNAAPFMMCTIPKVACTNFRKLLRVLMLHPEPLPKGADEQMWPAHFGVFPTLWQYLHSTTPVSDRYPSFILGRNPCASFHQSVAHARAAQRTAHCIKHAHAQQVSATTTCMLWLHGSASTLGMKCARACLSVLHAKRCPCIRHVCCHSLGCQSTAAEAQLQRFFCAPV